jgi:hypothetical protein
MVQAAPAYSQLPSKSHSQVSPPEPQTVLSQAMKPTAAPSAYAPPKYAQAGDWGTSLAVQDVPTYCHCAEESATMPASSPAAVQQPAKRSAEPGQRRSRL